MYKRQAFPLRVIYVPKRVDIVVVHVFVVVLYARALDNNVCERRQEAAVGQCPEEGEGEITSEGCVRLWTVTHTSMMGNRSDLRFCVGGPPDPKWGSSLVSIELIDMACGT